MKRIKNIVYILVVIFTLNSCQKNNDILYAKLEKEFYESIKNCNAKKFNYQEDGLVPQSSYFVNSKLKFLTLRFGGETVITEEKIIFESNSNSISKRIIRRIEYEWDDYKNDKKMNDYSDTVYIINYNKKNMECYVGNKIIETQKKEKILTQNYQYIFYVKRQTEKSYNSR